MLVLSRSVVLRALATLVAVGLLVTWYEATTDDSTERAAADQPTPPEPGAVMQFAATAYCKGTTTASGVAVRSGIAAADPAVLPLGSVIHIDSGVPKYDGVYTVLDTGPKVRGRLLDLYIWSCYEALDFGRRPVQVSVLRLGWGPEGSASEMLEPSLGLDP